MMSRTLRLAVGTLVVGIVVLALKTLAWRMTGSVALLSDALESTVNVATAIAALVAVRVAALPADAEHPYGHHKAEFLSAMLEGALIVVAAGVILFAAWRGLRAPVPLQAPIDGLLVNGLASVVNGYWCWRLITAGLAERSPALVADGRHLLVDVVSSVGVTFGVLLAIVWAQPLLDPAMALVVAAGILWSGWRVMRASLSGLLDESLPEAQLKRLRDVIAREATGAVEAHDLRTRHAGRATFIDFHLVVDGRTTVAQAHDLCDRLEAALKAVIEDAVVTIHVEPEHKAKHEGIVVL